MIKIDVNNSEFETSTVVKVGRESSYLFPLKRETKTTKRLTIPPQ
jgi:hypothetical protein